MASKLALYISAGLAVGETRIASLTEDREYRYVLDSVYDDVLAYCLGQGQWNFAMRTVRIDSDPALTPQFRYSYGFSRPDDWVRTCGLSASETLQPPLENYIDEGGTWFANVDPIYVQHVSNDVDFGNDLSLWPAAYQRYVELELAWRLSQRPSMSADLRDRLQRDLKLAKQNAMSKDAMDEAAPKYPQPGRLVNSRFGGARRFDRIGGRLIG